MNRRAFLTAASVGTLGALAGCTNPCPPDGAGGSSGLQGTIPGGGPPALQDITYQDRTHEAHSVEELQQHAQQSDGRIVWLPASNGYDLSGTDLSLENITLASGRSGDSKGATIYTTDQGAASHAWSGGAGTGTITLNDNARLSGVELRGPHTNVQNHDVLGGYFPFAPGGSSNRKDWRRKRFARGITVLGDNVTIDNCRIWGFSVQLIIIGSRGHTPQNTQIRYCSLTQSLLTSYGYGIDVRHGHPTVYRCYLDATRHALVTSGMADAGYSVLESTIGPWTIGHPIDSHRVGENQSGSSDPTARDYRYRAGGTLLVRGCDIIARRVPDLPFINHNRGGSVPAAHIRGIPEDGFYLENCALSHDTIQSGIEQSGVPGRYQSDEGEFANIYTSGNEWGVGFDALQQIP